MRVSKGSVMHKKVKENYIGFKHESQSCMKIIFIIKKNSLI